MSSVVDKKTTKKVVAQDFARYEFKYLLSLDQRLAIESEVEKFMRIDGHIDPDLDNQYFVRSLYFDSPANQAFYEKTDGIKSRKKYRIRTYTRNADTVAPIFLEQKGRYNERTYKHRFEIDKRDLVPLFTASAPQQIFEAYQGVELAEQFCVDIYRKHIKPKVLVDYLRRPYISDYDLYFRVTFDQKLQATASNMLFASKAAQAKACVAGWTVMEVKFNRRIPAWFHRILQAHNLRRLSISKFVVGMKVCGLAIDMS